MREHRRETSLRLSDHRFSRANGCPISVFDLELRRRGRPRQKFWQIRHLLNLRQG
jgi:hypothetical protein